MGDRRPSLFNECGYQAKSLNEDRNMAILDFDDVVKAHERIRMYIHHTPVMTSQTIDRLTGASVYFKCENFQKTGAFKFRGACNAVFSLPGGGGRGVVTHSSGNHAAALALAAGMAGIPAYAVMPRNAPAVKIAAVRGYGAKVILCEPSVESRESTASRIMEETGAVMVHPNNDERIIAGQGTSALEFVNEVDLDMILAPVGGGGLLSGTALAAAGWKPRVRAIGCEPEMADDAARSFRAGRIFPSTYPDTIADGLRTSLGDKTFAIIRAKVEDIVTVSENAIVEAMRIVFERMKIVIEPSSAVPLAALMTRAVDAQRLRVGVLLSGGNVDLTSFFDTISGKKKRYTLRKE